ncbi:MAG: ATP-dependent DNA helicase RecG, partial [Rhodospirillaceae bacterium]
MRPEILFPFFSPLIATKGLGKATAPLVERLIGGNQLVDLLWHWPQSRVDRRAAPPLAQAPDGAVISPLVRVVEHKPSPDGRFGKRRRGGGGAPSPYRVVVADDSGTMTLVWFHGQADWIARMLPADTERVVSGRVEWRGNELQMVHPDHVVPPEDAEIARTVEPVYPLTQGLSNKVISKIIRTALGVVGPAEDPHWPEWQDKALLAQRHWPDWNSALRQVHAPEEAKDLDRSHPARQRLIYDELLASQLALALTRRAMRRVQGQALKGDGRLRQAVRQALPFALTGAQERSLTEIEADLAAETRMLRLLQGDVGSGKTMVALLTLLVAVEAGRQGVLMAPTELVARQHVDSLAPLCEPLGVRIVLLTGRDKGKRRDSLVADLAEGRADIAIGTHALFQSDVQFQDLALAVVDEQHRFGVHQRLALSDKGRGVDVLVMTATPIPRTLALTHYGDMAVSRLDEKPPGRKPVDTRALPSSRLEDVMAGIESLANKDNIQF